MVSMAARVYLKQFSAVFAAERQEQHLRRMVLEVCYGIFVAKPWRAVAGRATSPHGSSRV